MSSTLRGYDRHKSDYYITPIKQIVKFLNEFQKIEKINGVILDPCAGGDKEHTMSYPAALKEIGVKNKIKTVDIRKDSRAEIKNDYLKLDCEGLFDIIITNPPFNIARKIIDKSLNDVKEGGFVIMLLRLNYFGSQKRFDLWNKHLPKYCFVHHKRMSFTDDGKTDSIEYCHMVWQKGHNPEFTKLKVI